MPGFIKFQQKRKAKLQDPQNGGQNAQEANNRYVAPNTELIMIEDDVENENKNSDNRLD